jgi:hypothetical protein
VRDFLLGPQSLALSPGEEPLQVHSVANANQAISNQSGHAQAGDQAFHRRFDLACVSPINVVKHSRQVFLLGRQNERRVDALALRADEGRGIAAISVGEP